MTRETVRTTYDAVASRYAEAMVGELDARPIERALLGHVMKDALGAIADLGCGPGHVTEWLAARGADVFGLDLSPKMIDEAKARFPQRTFRVGSMLALEDPSASWGAAVALYSIIHLTPDERKKAFAGLARVAKPNAPLLLSFHVSDAEHAMGSSIHLETWFETPVDLTGYFLDPEMVGAELEAAGFAIRVRLVRDPVVENEYTSRRCYFLAYRR